MRTFLRVRVSGVGTRTVRRATLRLQVGAATEASSVTGGSLQRITACTWDERTVTWANQPALDGAVLATAGRVAQGDVVGFDVTPAFQGDGIYCFALETASTDNAQYNSREGTGQRPAFIVELAP